LILVEILAMDLAGMHKLLDVKREENLQGYICIFATDLTLLTVSNRIGVNWRFIFEK